MYQLETNFLTDGNPISGLLDIHPYLVVATWGGTIQIRKLEPRYNLVMEITDIKNPFTCFTTFKDFIFVCKGNKAIDVWNLSEKKIVDNITNFTNSPQTLVASHNNLVLVSDNVIEVLLWKTGESLCVIDISEKPDHFKLEKIILSKHRIFWKYNFDDNIHIYNLKTFKEEKTISSQVSMNTFFVAENFLFIATDECIETGNDSCTLTILELSTQKQVSQIGKSDEESYFEIKAFYDSSKTPLYLYAATINSVDIWEWGTWKHLDQIDDIAVVHSCLFANNRIFIGDVEGFVDIWLKE